MWKSFKLAPWFIAAGITWSLGFVYNVFYGGELSWLRAMYLQKLEIAEKTQGERRLLITGGSGAHYTVDSQVIEQGLGIPVVNLGLDGPVGLDVILPSMLEQVRPGDTVLLIPEYLLLLDEDGYGDRSAQFGIAIGRPGLGGVPAKQMAQDLILLGVPSFRGVVKSGIDWFTLGKMTGYYSDPISDRGDPTVVKQREQDWWQLTINQPISPHATERIAQFRQEVEARGGTLILSLPWIYGSTDSKTVKNVRKTAEVLAQIAPVIYEPDSFNIKTDFSLFADTHYHLLPEGREVRAEEIVQQLKPIFEAIANKSPVPRNQSTQKVIFPKS
ncbi:hypothetical protein Sta7437_2979 [Stanieria cyanosphaera PCC 7437]|uniref:SGNH hydrolase-type esterase domain-containing protein n=1 Tax=Stanieria cyanosphaera (strain ATCC 29371 / PCC 7437) TaxID=111780 RepID=K9XVC0_STAC7|nr:hypothetical protein [Stanieria cyanosphaera]AFZ36498.1 hypothetical protein Sta7437_2979 [Stanieria cyanosphaera PCC 7437]